MRRKRHECRHEPKRAPHIEMEEVDVSVDVLLLGKNRRNQKTAQAEEDKHGDLPGGELGCESGVASKDCHPCQGPHAIQNGLMAEEASRVGFGGRRSGTLPTPPLFNSTFLLGRPLEDRETILRFDDRHSSV